MQITCPDCSSRYLVKPSAIGEKGRRVKCTRCHSVWFQEPLAPEVSPQPVVEPEPVATNPIPEGGNVPALQKEQAPVWQKAMFAASFLLCFMMLIYAMAPTILSAAPWLSAAYKMMGVYDTEGVGITAVSMDQVQDGDKLKLVLSGTFVNISDEDKHMPLLRVSVYNQSDKVLNSAVLTPQEAVLEAKGETPFYNMIPSVSPNATRVVLDIGDPYSLKKR